MRAEARERSNLLADRIADELFTAGGPGAEKARRLVLMGENEKYLGGWCFAAVRDRLRLRLVEEERDRWGNVPEIVCLCGSTRFWREFQRASLRETLRGNIVLSIGAASGTDEEHFGNLPRESYDRIKAGLDALHLRKIDLADRVLILNVGGYMGESTRNEMEYARSKGKRIEFLEPIEIEQ